MICFNVPEFAEGGACCADAKVTQEIKTRESIADAFVIAANVSPTDLFSANVFGMSVISGKAILLFGNGTPVSCVTFSPMSQDILIPNEENPLIWINPERMSG